MRHWCKSSAVIPGKDHFDSEAYLTGFFFFSSLLQIIDRRKCIMFLSIRDKLQDCEKLNNAITSWNPSYCTCPHNFSCHTLLTCFRIVHKICWRPGQPARHHSPCKLAKKGNDEVDIPHCVQRSDISFLFPWLTVCHTMDLSCNIWDTRRLLLRHTGLSKQAISLRSIFRSKKLKASMDFLSGDL